MGIFLLLEGCTVENKYHEVAEPLWNQLSAAQKQLIVDRDFEKEFGEDVIEK